MMSGMFLYFSKATIEFNIRNTLKIYIYSTYVPLQVVVINNCISICLLGIMKGNLAMKETIN